MGLYMYAIKVNYSREIVTECHEAEVSNPLTVEKLRAIIGNNTFSICDSEEQFSNHYEVCWTTKRPETDEEMAERIRGGEIYNRNREEFLATGKLPNVKKD
jgi:hypothetical protein